MGYNSVVEIMGLSSFV